MPLPFDTLAYAESLKHSGFTEDQAKALAEMRLDLEHAKGEIEALRKEVSTLKVGQPASAEEVHQLKVRLILAETFVGNWPWTLGMVVLVAAVVSLLLADVRG